MSRRGDRSASRFSRPSALLACGALLGALLAATGILEKPQQQSVHDPVARVNGEAIRREEFLGDLDLLASDKRNKMSSADRRHVLDRIIEERLLIERGLSIGLASSDSAVRKTIVDAMIQTVISDSSSALPSDEQLRDFYRDNTDYFARFAS